MNSKIFITLNLLDNSILLNEGVLNALDWPRQVQLLINNDEKMLVLRACTVEDRQAVVVPDEHIAQFEISERTLFKKIKRLLGWEDECPRMCYGEYLPAHQAFNAHDLVAYMNISADDEYAAFAQELTDMEDYF